MSQCSTAAIRVPARPLVRPHHNPQAPARSQAPRLRVVAPVQRRSAGGLALLSVALLGFGLMVLLLLNISIGKGAYALTELQQQQRTLAETKQALAEQVQQVSAPQELAKHARRLGMVPAPNTAFVRLPDGRVEGQPQTATAPPKPTPKTAKVTSRTGTTGGTTGKTGGTTGKTGKASGTTSKTSGTTGKTGGTTGKTGGTPASTETNR